MDDEIQKMAYFRSGGCCSGDFITFYYLDYAKGYVLFSANPQNIKLTIEGKDYQSQIARLWV